MRSVVDMNICQFQGRVATEPEMVEKLNKQGVPFDEVSFKIVCQSNRYSVFAKYYIPCVAIGYRAKLIKEKIHVGDSVFIVCEYKPISGNKSKGKGKDKKSDLYGDIRFDVQHLVVERLGQESIRLLDAEEPIPEDPSDEPTQPLVPEATPLP